MTTDTQTGRAHPEAIKAVPVRHPGRWVAIDTGVQGLVHGDYRLDNLMFPERGDGVVALDWQTLAIGPPGRDLAYFLATSVLVDDRREH